MKLLATLLAGALAAAPVASQVEPKECSGGPCAYVSVTEIQQLVNKAYDAGKRAGQIKCGSVL